MSSIFARVAGMGDDSFDAAAVVAVLQRRGGLSRAEAQVLLLDYLGISREEICAELRVSTETVRTYWKRIYQKVRCRARPEAYAWLEALIQRELGAGG